MEAEYGRTRTEIENTEGDNRMAQFYDVRRLGSGGFGEVWACTSGGVRYAKKKLTAIDEDSVARFQREVRILSKLDHPNIVKVVAKRLQTSPYWYVMPLYRRSLESELPGRHWRDVRLVHC